MAGRKSTSGSKRKTAKKTARSTKPRKRKAAPKQRSFAFKLCFWPFLLIGFFTQSWHPVIRWPARIIACVGLVMLCCGAILGACYYTRALQYDLDKVAEMPARTIVYARDGRTELGKLHGDNRYIVTFDEVSPNFRNALIAREDARFYKHYAVDPRSVLRAIRNTLQHGKREGASTITMQLARNTFPLGGRTLDRKLLEIAVAFRIEQKYKKDEILQHYMNRIFWGHSIRGVEAASRTYFEKPAKNLTLSEGAMLAGIIRGPNTFSPFKDVKAAANERDVTLNNMVRYGYITSSDADVAKNEPLRVRPKNRRVIHETYVMDTVRHELDRILEDHNIEDGGLTVITTIDHTIQRSAELAVERNLVSEVEKTPGYRHQTRKQWRQLPPNKQTEPKYVQGACVVIENRTGAILTVVGGRNANESRFNRAVQAKRQIGSIFKPFVFLTAFDQGMMPGTWIRDGRIRPGEIDGAPPSWSPKNSDGKFGGAITAEKALIRSRNTSSVRVGDFAGIKAVSETAYDVGFIDGMPQNPASYLGSWEATPLQVASAYTVFPNNGDWYRPYIIQEIRNSNGERVYPGKGDSGKLVVSAAEPGSAWCVSSILQKVVDRGTGRNVRNKGYNAPCAGKTGTTDAYKDAWFAGYTANLTCAVWVGMDTPKTIINRGYGSKLAAPIWVDVMKTADRLGYATPKFKPLRLREATLCRWSGQYATAGCSRKGCAYRQTVPLDRLPAEGDYCSIHPLRGSSPGRRRPPPRAIPLEE